MKNTILVVLLFAVGCCAEALWAADGFVLCKSTYALCTTAKCTPIPGKKDTVSCACDVKTGYSAGQKACQEPKETAEGTQVHSRYYPVKAYAVCSNSRPWGWCLDKPCTIDKNDPSKASCACTLVKNQGPYVVVTDTYNKSTCTTDVWSSATVTQIDQVTDFLKEQDQLKPFPIDVINKK